MPAELIRRKKRKRKKYIKNSQNWIVRKQPNLNNGQNLNRQFTKGNTWMANRHMKRCLSLVINEIKIKNTIRYQYIAIQREKWKWPTIPNGGKNVEDLECSYTVCGNVKGYNHFGNQFGSFSKSSTYAHCMIYLSNS